MNDRESSPYRIVAEGTAHQVVSESGQVLIECTDQRNAQHYAELLTRAYRAGYKAALRHARASAQDQR